jgi:anionic cell wall polymer biosynthesis LytR-Cps2A-Psr (LCP) family protein
MDGATALKFVRSRHSDQHGGDFARSQRQVAVLEGVKKMALSMSALDDLPAFTNQFLNMLETDIKLSDLENISNLVVNPEELEIKTLILNTDNVFVDSSGPSGEYILIPKAGTDNWQEIHTFIFEALNN